MSKTVNKIYMVTLSFALVVLLISLNFSHKPQISITEYQTTQDNTDYLYKYQLKNTSANEAAEMLLRQENAIKKDVKISYNTETNVLYVKALQDDYDSILEPSLAKFDVVQPQIYLETLSVVVNKKLAEKLKNEKIDLDKIRDKILFRNNVLARNNKNYEINDANQNFNLHLKVSPQINDNLLTLAMSQRATTQAETAQKKEMDQIVFSDLTPHETVIIESALENQNSVVTFITPYLIRNYDDYQEVKNRREQE